MRGLARLYRALLRIALLEQIQYRASGVIWMTGSILEPLVFLNVWRAVAEARGEAVAGYDAGSFAAYYVTMLVVNHLTFAWIMHTFQYRVQEGALAFELLRPVHPIHNDLCANLAYKALMMVIVTPAVVGMTLGFDARFDGGASAALLFVPALLLAFVLRFALEWTLALIAFYTTRVMAFNQLYFVVLMLLSGRIAPLDVFPDVVARAAALLPFYYMLAFPVEVALGRVQGAQLVSGFVSQAVWIGVALATIQLAWRRSVRRFTAVGA